MHSVELFAGCGGLAYGLSQAGFRHCLVVERDPHALATLRLNKADSLEHVRDWPIRDGDVCDIDYSEIALPVSLVSGGPPCQPFSIGGKHLGPQDPRNMWPEAIRAVEQLRPTCFLFENVRGLLRPSFEEYLTYLVLRFSWPDLSAKRQEDWTDHLVRLKKHAGRHPEGSEYRVIVRPINAADYGAAQKRHRALLLGVRRDATLKWEFPQPTHSQAALAWSKQVSGEYWKRHRLRPSDQTELTPSEARALVRQIANGEPSELPWVTVRDRLKGLPKPNVRGRDYNHRQHPGARVYPNHSGSTWDDPAKALKAGAHGVPGGENVLAPGDGTVRYFTVREMARLQGLPDDFMVEGSWAHVTRQLGNAAPAEIGYRFGLELARLLPEKRADRVVTPDCSPRPAARSERQASL